MALLPVLIGSIGALVLLQTYWKDPHSLVSKFAITNDQPVIRVHEGRHGIITITEAKSLNKNNQRITDNVVYGGNVYDGKTNVDLELNSNGLERPLALHVLNPNAKRILVLGLSIGSWLTVVEGFPGVEAIDVIEINSGYLELAALYGPQRRALQDSRVSVHVDDARRWLKFNPEKKNMT